MGFRSSTRAPLSAMVLLSAMVAACGGGGGGGGGGAAPPQPSAPVPPPASQLLDWDAHPAATIVLGQDNMDSDRPDDLSFAQGSPAVTDGGRLYVVTEGRVKEFDNYAAGGAIAQRTHSFAAGASNVSVRGGKLVFTNDDGVFIYNDGFQGTADVFSSGITDCGANAMNGPQSAILSPDGHLIVADTSNNRVLIWNPDIMPAAGELPEPSVVVGQRNMNSCSPNDETGDGGPNGSTLFSPRAVWSDGIRLVVADSDNNRLLIWDQIPQANFQLADHVVGQANFIDRQENRDGTASEFTLCAPESVDVNAVGQMAVADSCNHRVLVWDSVPRSDSAPANHVIGQGSFTNNAEPAGPTSRNLRFPSGVRFDERNLIVVDHGHSRVLVFPAAN